MWFCGGCVLLLHVHCGIMSLLNVLMNVLMLIMCLLMGVSLVTIWYSVFIV